MRDAGFLPTADLLPRVAATEDEAYCGRGMVRGTVHDENAWSLGGAVGHAGMFATAADVARLGEMIRRGGELDGTRVLRESTVAMMCTDQLPDHVDPGFRQGLAVRIGDPSFMGSLSGTRTVGHTGFTGTSLVVDPVRGVTLVLLTNRVHPSRTWSDVGHVRRTLADLVAGMPGPVRRQRPGPKEEASPSSLGLPGLLVRIRAEMPTLRPAELRVALAILEDPAGAAGLAIGTLARRCDTSPATVLRFCRAVGFTSYPALRLELARETGRERDGQGPPSPTGDISPTDTVPQIVAKIAWSDARAIEDTAALLDVASLEAAIDAVSGAGRIDIYGVGASGFVAQDLHQKLHRIGLLSSVSPDPHAALTSAALLGPGDVAIAISHTGTTTDTVEALRVAEASGATTIAITNVRDSPLTHHARLVLTTASRETTFRSGAMASRIAQLAVVDCLFVGVAQRSWDRTLRALERTFVAVQGRRIQPGRRRTRTAGRMAPPE
jgi:DNA-binding MurR/RpiR family transcriptional regulator